MRVIIATLLFAALSVNANAENCYVGDGYFITSVSANEADVRQKEQPEIKQQTKKLNDSAKYEVAEVKPQPIKPHPIVKHGQVSESIIMVNNTEAKTHDAEWAKIIKKYNNRAAKPKAANEKVLKAN